MATEWFRRVRQALATAVSVALAGTGLATLPVAGRVIRSLGLKLD